MVNAQLMEFVILILAIGAITLVYWFSRKQTEKAETENTYLEALEHLVEGNERLSIEKLKETVRSDTENVSAYLLLGDVLRKRGLHANATRIHKDLTLRQGLPSKTQQKIYKSLFMDYLALNDTKSAIQTANKVLEFDQNQDIVFIQQLLQVLVRAEKWSEALDLIQQHREEFPEKIHEKEALFMVFQGMEIQEKGRGKEARTRFKEALKKDSNCSAAHYYIGKSYINEARLEDAAKTWTKYCQAQPRKAFFLYPELEKVWFELGRFLEAEQFYQELFSNDRGNIWAGLALSSIYVKKGNFDQSMEIIQQLEDIYPDSEMLLRHKIQHYYQRGQYKQASGQAIEYFGKENGVAEFCCKCKECNHLNETPVWKCPECHAINSFGL